MNVKSSEQRLRRGMPLGSNYLLHGEEYDIFLVYVQNNVLILYCIIINVYSGLKHPEKQQVIRVKPSLH